MNAPELRGSVGQLLSAGTAAHDPESQATQALYVLARVAACRTFDAAALQLTVELQTELGVDRVSFGMIEAGRMRVLRLGSSTRHDDAQDNSRDIESAMESVSHQLMPVWLSVGDSGPSVDVNVRALVQRYSTHVLLLPLFVDDTLFGALCCQRRSDQPAFTEPECERADMISALSCAYLGRLREAERSWWARLRQECADVLSSLRQPDRPKRRLGLAAAGLVTALLFGVPVDQIEKGDAVLVSNAMRTVTAPMAGFIARAPVSAGDRVRVDDLLVALDDREQQLELATAQSEKLKIESRLLEAQATYNLTEQNVLLAQLDQVKVRIQKSEYLLSRSVQKAPFDGVIISGDLRQRIGDAVGQGDVLFELAPDQGVYARMWVKQSRIADISLGQRGELRFPALAGASFAVAVTRVSPSTLSRNGNTFHQVELTLSRPMEPGRLISGMEGTAVLVTGRTSLFDRISRDLLEWMRLQYWRWLL